MGMFFTCDGFFFDIVESIEKVEFERAKLLFEFVTVDPFERNLNLFFESFNVLFNSEFDFEDKVETFDD